MYCVVEDKVCGGEEFTCRGLPGECVPLNWMCDDNQDCSDGSDEKACSKAFISSSTAISVKFLSMMLRRGIIDFFQWISLLSFLVENYFSSHRDLMNPFS